ncbi:thiamine phosphate synthase [Daejeonella oryzae]|uniref:thiamine phosphate synthase n=1 Tax=Daejeonella oryzae TaxID=1122943 RepID=UPI000403BFDE|nr:thiamine phosphate synthase [Daejeonella oryzae]
MRKYISRFHYLTQDLPHRSHAEQTQIACEAGANWIQYRCFSKDDEELINEIHQVASICDDWGATLILTDHYHLLHLVDAQGVHLENIEADFKMIRERITDEKTLGASANSIDDIYRISTSGVVDYIGCGPYAFTKTKPNDYPVLGFEAYRSIISKMNDQQIDIPLIAVGGIKPMDVDDLLTTGIQGIAVSAAINAEEDPYSAFKEFYKKISL